jgi:hypothetical protein
MEFRNKSKPDCLTRFLPLCTLVYNKRLASLSSKASSKGLSSRRGGTQTPSSGGDWRPPSFHILTAKCEGQNVSGKMFTNGFDSCPRYQISHLSSPILCSLCTDCTVRKSGPTLMFRVKMGFILFLKENSYFLCN